MTPLATVLARIGWTPAEFARRSGYTPGHAWDMSEGRRRTDPAMLEVLERLAAAVEAHPLPKRRPYQRRAA